MKILVINGPNLNMLGIREPDHYGRETYADLVKKIETYCESKDIGCECYQSNHEGDLVDKIQQAYGVFDGIVINPGAYTHTSIAILDAAKSACRYEMIEFIPEIFTLALVPVGGLVVQIHDLGAEAVVHIALLKTFFIVAGLVLF